MMTTFHNRLAAICEHFEKDHDDLRMKRELSRLQIDVEKSIKRAFRTNDGTDDLEQLLTIVDRNMEAL